MQRNYLHEAEHRRLDELRLIDPFVEEVLRQLDKILNSEKFSRVQQKAKDLLRYIVAKRLLGLADQIKEMTIAMAVYGESSDFNPSENAKVRVAVGDLRERLAEYYGGEGANDPIALDIPLETYVPELRDRRVFVDVSQFDDWHPQRDQEHLCRTLSDEITYQLNQAGWVRARRVDVLAAGADGTGYGFRGSLESKSDVLRLNISLGHLPSGRIVCSRILQGRRDNALRLAGEIVELLSRVLQEDTQHDYALAIRSRKREG